MVRELVAQCSRCSEKLIATKLSCNNCELELNGDFPLSKFDYLSTDEIDFIESFLKAILWTQKLNFFSLHNIDTERKIIKLQEPSSSTCCGVL
jgi:hypothetical protein